MGVSVGGGSRSIDSVVICLHNLLHGIRTCACVDLMASDGLKCCANQGFGNDERYTAGVLASLCPCESLDLRRKVNIVRGLRSQAAEHQNEWQLWNRQLGFQHICLCFCCVCVKMHGLICTLVPVGVG